MVGIARVRHLRRAGLARDGVVLERSLLRSAAFHGHGLERGHHLTRGVRGHGLLGHLRLKALHIRAAIPQSLDQHRAHEPAFVGNRRHRHHHLQVCDIDAVAHRDARDGQTVPLLHRPDAARAFAFERDARLLPEAEARHVVVELLLAEAIDGDLGRADVRRLGDDALNREIAVAAIVIVQRAVLEVPAPVLAEEHVVERDGIFIQRRGDNDDLEGRAGFVTIIDQAIAQGLGLRLARQIWIEVRKAAQREDFSRARTHHDAAATDRRILLRGFAQLFLQHALDEHVEGEHHAEAGARINILLTINDQFALATISLGDAPTGRALELGIKPMFDAVEADDLVRGGSGDGIGVKALHFLHETQDVRRQVGAGIDALIVIRAGDALAAQRAKEVLLGARQFALLGLERQLVHRLRHRAPLLDGELALEIDEAVGANRAVVVRLDEAQREGQLGFLPRNQRSDDFGDGGLMGMNHRGISHHALDGPAGGELIVVRVEDVPAPRRFDVAALGVALDHVGVLPVLDHLNAIQLRTEADEANHDQRREGKQVPEMYHTNHVRNRRPASFAPKSKRRWWRKWKSRTGLDELHRPGIGARSRSGGFVHPEDLVRLRLHEAELQFLHALREKHRALQGREIAGQVLVVFAELLQPRLPRADLLAQIEDLVLLHHVADGESADERAEEHGLERGHEADGSRLIATMIGHGSMA